VHREVRVNQSMPQSATRRAIVLFWRALLLRCPVCGNGGIFQSWFKLQERCPTCAFVYARGEHGYQLGSMALGLVIPMLIWILVFLGILLATWPNPPWFWLQWGSIAFMIVFPILFYPVSHTLAIALDLLVRPPDQREGREGSGESSR
jgi:uncharacterized protein (DUF983 family)